MGYPEWCAEGVLSHTVLEELKVLKMENLELIRRMILVDGLSRREVQRRLGHGRNTINKALANAVPVPYTISDPRKRPKLDPFEGVVRAWLTDEQTRPRKQRHTAVRIWERLTQEHNFTGSRRAVSDLVHSIRRALTAPEIFVPIDHPPGAEYRRRDRTQS